MLPGRVGYFRTLWSEIKKALFLPSPRRQLVKDVYKDLQHESKNNLIRILTRVVADQQKTLPILKNKEELKSWSKKMIIKNIIAYLQKN